MLTPVAAALPQITTGRKQVHLHLQAAGKRLNQLHLHRSQGTDPEQAKPLRQPVHRAVRPAQQLHGLANLHPERLLWDHIGDRPPEQRLPIVDPRLGEGAPMGQKIGAIQAVIVEGIGDGPCQLPAITAQASGHPRLPLIQPAPQRQGLSLGEQIRQLIQHGPHQTTGPPGILLIERHFKKARHQLTQATAGKRKPNQRTDSVGLRELLTQPAAGGPCVHHHIHRLQRPWRLLQQLLSQQCRQKFSPVAAVQPQQLAPSPLSRAGSPTRSAGSCHR